MTSKNSFFSSLHSISMRPSSSLPKEIKISEISKMDPSMPDNPIYNFLNGKYADIDKEVEAKDWTGVKQFPSGANFILYAKLKDGDYILESALFSNEEYIYKTEGEEIIELNY